MFGLRAEMSCSRGQRAGVKQAGSGTERWCPATQSEGNPVKVGYTASHNPQRKIITVGVLFLLAMQKQPPLLTTAWAYTERTTEMDPPFYLPM